MAARRTTPAGATKTQPAPQAPMAGRTPKGTFAKGCSGNPGGRRPDLAEVRELARTYANTAIETLVEIAKSGKSEASRIAASVALLDRGYGRPAQPIEGEMGAPLAAVLVIPTEERREKARAAVEAAFAQYTPAIEHADADADSAGPPVIEHEPPAAVQRDRELDDRERALEAREAELKARVARVSADMLV